MIKINLLSEGKRPAAVRKTRSLALEGKDIGQWLLAAAVLVGILAGVVYWWTLAQTIEQKDQEIADAEKKVEELAPIIREVEEYKDKKDELRSKIEVINQLKLAQRGPVRVMDAVSRALPELLWLDRMQMSASSIQIEGRAFNTNAVASFIENLDKVPEFEEPSLKDALAQSGGVYKFVVTFNYTYAPLAQEAVDGSQPAIEQPLVPSTG